MQLPMREKLRNMRCLVNAIAPGLESALVALVMVGAATALVGWPAQAGAQQEVVATVGSHPITAKELDAKIAPQLAAARNEIYQLKRNTIRSIADEYLLEQAAQREKLTVAEYLKREFGNHKVTEAEAKKYYDEHKAQIRRPYDEIEKTLI